MNEVIILGGQGTGMVAASILEQQGFKIKGFLNDVLPVHSSIGKYRSFPVLGKMASFTDWLKDTNIGFHVAIVGYKHKKLTYEKLLSLNLPADRLINVIAPSATIPEGYCSIGRGVQLLANSYVSVDTCVGDYCALFSGAYLLHDSTLEEFVHIGANAVIGADVLIKKAAFIGTNVTVKEKVVIGCNSIVGAGSVVIRDVPDNTVVAGNPARILRKL